MKIEQTFPYDHPGAQIQYGIPFGTDVFHVDEDLAGAVGRNSGRAQKFSIGGSRLHDRNHEDFEPPIPDY